jgi:KH-domain-like of EngA bacterial GTPase enzymes, C-terminal
VIWALRVVQRAHVVVLVVDGTVGVTEHDKHVAGFILDHMKSVVVAVNKWDIFPQFKREIQEEKPKKQRMSHYEWAKHTQDLVHKIVANDKAGIIAWEKGTKGRKRKDMHDEKTKPTESKHKHEEKEKEEKSEEAEVEVVQVNTKPKKEVKMNELTRELLAAEEQQETKRKRKKQTTETQQSETDDINFDELEKNAVEFEIPLSPPPTSPPKDDANNAHQRAKQHKPTQDEEVYESATRTQLNFLPFVPFTFISATTGYRVPSLMDLAVEVFHERGKRIKTQDMFEILRTAVLRHKLPTKGRNLLRVRFATQVDAYPPTFVFFVNNPEVVQNHYEKFLETCIREKYKFLGTPIRLLFKKNSNKFVKNKK